MGAVVAKAASVGPSTRLGQVLDQMSQIRKRAPERSLWFLT